MSTAVFIQYSNGEQELFSFEDGSNVSDIYDAVSYAHKQVYYIPIESTLVSTTEGDWKHERVCSALDQL